MEPWLFILLPFALIGARVAAFVFIAPVFGYPSVPAVVKVGVVFWLTLFFSILTPPSLHATHMPWFAAALMLVWESIIGLAMGLAARMVFLAIHQGGAIISQQMGLSDAGVIDPNSGEEAEALGSFLEMVLTLVFLTAGGHLLLIAMVAQSYKVFPLGSPPDMTAMASGLVTAGSVMLMLGLKLAGPFIVAFLILMVVLAIVARALPEMNILFESYPLRVGLGLFLVAAILPSMNSFTEELARWMNRFLVT